MLESAEGYYGTFSSRKPFSKLSNGEVQQTVDRFYAFRQEMSQDEILHPYEFIQEAYKAVQETYQNFLERVRSIDEQVSQKDTVQIFETYKQTSAAPLDRERRNPLAENPQKAKEILLKKLDSLGGTGLKVKKTLQEYDLTFSRMLNSLEEVNQVAERIKQTLPQYGSAFIEKSGTLEKIELITQEFRQALTKVADP